MSDSTANENSRAKDGPLQEPCSVEFVSRKRSFQAYYLIGSVPCPFPERASMGEALEDVRTMREELKFKFPMRIKTSDVSEFVVPPNAEASHGDTKP